MGDNTLKFEIDKDRMDTMDRSYRTEDDDKILVEAASSISGGFIWSETKEGHNFWEYAVRRLVEISKIGKEKENKEDDKDE